MDTPYVRIITLSAAAFLYFKAVSVFGEDVGFSRLLPRLSLSLFALTHSHSSFLFISPKNALELHLSLLALLLNAYQLYCSLDSVGSSNVECQWCRQTRLVVADLVFGRLKEWFSRSQSRASPARHVNFFCTASVSASALVLLFYWHGEGAPIVVLLYSPSERLVPSWTPTADQWSLITLSLCSLVWWIFLPVFRCSQWHTHSSKPGQAVCRAYMLEPDFQSLHTASKWPV